MAFGLSQLLSKARETIAGAYETASDFYLHAMRNTGIRATAYGLYQVSIPVVYYFAATAIYGFPEANAGSENTLVYCLNIAGDVILFAGSAAIAYHLGKHQNALEEGKEDKPNCLVRAAPRIFAAEHGFITGVQLYAFTGHHVIDNLLANRILMTASGVVTAALSSRLTASERGTAILVLPKLYPDNPLAYPEDIHAERSWRYLLNKAQSIARYSGHIMPAVRTVNMFNFLAMAMNTSGPTSFNMANNFGVYSNILGFGAGFTNLLAFLCKPSYLGENTKNLMSYFLYSTYGFLGLMHITLTLMMMFGDMQDADATNLGGWIYLLAFLALGLSGAIAYDQHRQQLTTREDILLERSRQRVVEIEMQPLGETRLALQRAGFFASPRNSVIIEELREDTLVDGRSSELTVDVEAQRLERVPQPREKKDFCSRLMFWRQAQPSSRNTLTEPLLASPDML
ncbi:hypothetical protein [Legionella nagasakiensis]|uniref:hypothetical protein n=1 Tax=Legionella nagasakiensis TaxID=535290 RepID=UPI00105463C4|nr:hypothetical protein [Legionella nagasakiensis]